MAVMSLIVALTAFIAGAIAEQLTFYDHAMPITLIEYSYGKDGESRVEHLEAVIQNHHLTSTERMNFPPFGPIENIYQAARESGDERGHLLGPQFSGPATWYNLSPQNARVNRDMGYQSISTDWYEAECEVRRFLEGGSYRRVQWSVNMTYVGESNRPDKYHLTVHFEEPCLSPVGSDINIEIQNSPQQEDSAYWICRKCHTNCERAINICHDTRITPTVTLDTR